MAEEAQEGKEQELSEVEKLAVEIGWNPEFEGDGAKTAAEYIRDGREIQNTMRDGWRADRRKLDALNNSVAQIKTHFKRAIENERAEAQAAIKKLQGEREAAIQDGDVKKVNEIETQIQVESRKAQAPPEEKPDDSAAQAWVAENEWFNKDADMQAFAVGLDNSGVPLDEITRRVKKTFPDYFEKGKPPTPPAPAVEGGGKPPATSRETLTEKDLSRAELQIADDFIAQGLYKNRKEYLKAVSKEA